MALAASQAEGWKPEHHAGLMAQNERGVLAHRRCISTQGLFHTSGDAALVCTGLFR